MIIITSRQNFINRRFSNYSELRHKYYQLDLYRIFFSLHNFSFVNFKDLRQKKDNVPGLQARLLTELGFRWFNPPSVLPGRPHARWQVLLRGHSWGWEKDGGRLPTAGWGLVQRIKSLEEVRTLARDWLKGNLPALPPYGTLQRPRAGCWQPPHSEDGPTLLFTRPGVGGGDSDICPRSAHLHLPLWLA